MSLTNECRMQNGRPLLYQKVVSSLRLERGDMMKWLLILALALIGHLNGAAAPVPDGRVLLDTFMRNKPKSLQEIAFMKLAENSYFCAMRFAMDQGIFSLAKSYSAADLDAIADACINDADVKKFNAILCASVLPCWKARAD